MLARGQAHGTYFFEGTPLEAARSFWAMALCFPMFFVLGRFAGAGDSLHDWTIEALGFAIAWLGFALASEAMAGMTGRGAVWPRFIAVWNWTTLFQYAALLFGSAIGMAFGGGVAPFASIAVLSYALWLEWFATKHALEVPGPTAVMFVLLDLAVGLFVQAVVLRVTA